MCQPHFPVEHDSVILAVNLAAHVVAQIPTHVRAVFVSALVSVFVFLVQVVARRGVVQSAHHERLRLAHVQGRSDKVKTVLFSLGEVVARQVHIHVQNREQVEPIGECQQL